MSNDKNYMRKYMLERYHKQREEAIRLLGGKCVWCGSKNRLNIDHIDVGLKKLNMARQYCNKDKYFEELEKCQLLCDDCHIEKSKNEIKEMKLRYWSDRRARSLTG